MTFGNLRSRAAGMVFPPLRPPRQEYRHYCNGAAATLRRRHSTTITTMQRRYAACIAPLQRRCSNNEKAEK